ncbi:hypothetical protein QQG55_19570 [Brugia pahangi]
MNYLQYTYNKLIHCHKNTYLNCPLDYEDPIQRDGFTLGIRVYDGRYYATTKLYIELQDRNDNPPVINGPQYVQLHEDAWLGKEVAKFTVQDADENDTAV